MYGAIAAAAAVGSYHQAQQQALARMSPAERAAYRTRQRERREREAAQRRREALDACPEVALARSVALDLRLSPAAAEQLLEFARQLARERCA